MAVYPIKFSVVIPSYNRAVLIPKTIQSVLDQTVQDFEIIVVDDGSKDNTEEVVRVIPDSRISYYKKENGERGAARNYGAARAKGQYVTFIDSDDWMYPFYFEEALKIIEKHDTPEIFHMSYEFISPEGEVLAQKFHEKDLNAQELKENVMGCIGVVVRNDIINTYQFSEDRRLSGTEDWLLWLRIGSRFPIRFSDRITAAALNHDDRSVLNFNEEQLAIRGELLIKYLKEDEHFVKTNGKHLARIEAHMDSYTAIHLALMKEKRRALHYWLKAIRLNKGELFTRRSLAVLKWLVVG